MIGGHLPFILRSSHPVSVGIRVLEYSIRYSIEYSNSKKLDSHSPSHHHRRRGKFFFEDAIARFSQYNRSNDVLLRTAY